MSTYQDTPLMSKWVIQNKDLSLEINNEQVFISTGRVSTLVDLKGVYLSNIELSQILRQKQLMNR